MSLDHSDTYCPHCGSEITNHDEYCPDCGGLVADGQETHANEQETKANIGERGYTYIGAGSGFIALLLFPPVFGLISIFSGVQLFRKFNERRGIGMMIWGGMTLISGVILGAFVFGV